jgi:hypothetical protein
MIYYYIYKTTNLINNKIYVGKRQCECLPELDTCYLGSGKFLRLAFVKYGKENFTKEILEITDKENLNNQERYWIEKLDARNRKIGYNVSKGGDGGNIVGLLPNKEEVYKKISKAVSGKKRPNTSAKMKGRVFSESHKEKLRVKRPYHSEIMKGRKKSDEVRQKFKDGWKKVKNVICPHCGVEGRGASMKNRHFDNCIVVKPENKERWKLSNEAKEKLKLIAKDREKSACKYCNKLVKAGALKRFHNENCKLSPTYNPKIYKCTNCGFESTSKTLINRFHNTNCKRVSNKEM